jgi:hypothetical protein
MSCETNSNKVGKAAGVRAGISAAACKVSNAAGPMAHKAMAQVGKHKAPIVMAGLAMGGMGALAAGAVVAPAPVKDKARDAAASAGDAVAGAAASARQAVGDATMAAGDAATSTRGTAAAAGGKIAGAAASARQAAGDVAASVKGAAGAATDAYAGALDRVGDAVGERVAPVASKALGVSNNPVAGWAARTGKKLFISRNPALMPVAFAAGMATTLARAGTGAAATRRARASRTELAGTVVREKRQLLFFKGKEAVAMWRSSMTDRLNRADLLGSHRLKGAGVHASDGVMFETKGARTWHRGTSLVSTSKGRRTVTHLQSLTLPGEHHYFDRRIGDEQAVGIATGRLEAQKVPGYVSSISPQESLVPMWAASKRAAINSVLYWGDRA